MINWKQKLSSRKFWTLVAAFAVSLAVLIGAGTETTEKIAGLIGAVGSVAVYILAEAKVDAARKDDNGEQN